MKISKLGLMVIGIATTGLFAFKAISINGSVKGTVSPANEANMAWIVSSTDTLKVPVDKGTFEIRDVKPGVYKVIIEAKPPYKNAATDAITVNDGQVIDVGEIKLAQ
jgi:hypothetical protein